MKESSTFQMILLVAFGFIALLAVLVFAGIIPLGSSSSSSQDLGSVTVWGTYDQNNLNAFFAKLNQADTKRVTFTYLQKDPETYADDLIEAFARGEGPDLFFADQKMLNRLTGKITAIPYTSYPERTFLDTFVDGSTVLTDNTGIKIMPLFVDPLVMYYNRSLYTGSGIVAAPKTWTEFISTLSGLNKQDAANNFIQTGAPLGEFRNITNAKGIFSALLFQAGNNIVDLDAANGYEVILDSNNGNTASATPATGAATFYLQFSDPTLNTYSWNRSMDNDKDMFVAEKSAVYFGLASEYSDLKAKNPHLDFDIADLPQLNLSRKMTYGDFYGLAIASNSKNQTGAIFGAALLAGADNDQTLSGLASLSPARRDLLAQNASTTWEQSFNRSAIFTYSWVDPDDTKTTSIFQTMLETVQTNQANLTNAITNASNQISLLFSRN